MYGIPGLTVATVIDCIPAICLLPLAYGSKIRIPSDLILDAAPAEMSGFQLGSLAIELRRWLGGELNRSEPFRFDLLD